MIEHEDHVGVAFGRGLREPGLGLGGRERQIRPRAERAEHGCKRPRGERLGVGHERSAVCKRGAQDGRDRAGTPAEPGGEPEGAAGPRCALHPDLAAHELSQSRIDG